MVGEEKGLHNNYYSTCILHASGLASMGSFSVYILYTFEIGQEGRGVAPLASPFDPPL